MFERADKPRAFGLAPGVDFPKALVEGLRARLAGKPPHEAGRVELVVNTRRMARRIRQIYDAGPPALLPRIRLITDLDALTPQLPLPPATPPLQRRLELTQLVQRLLDSQPELAPRSSLYALSDSLAALMDEMQGEGVSPEDIAALDVSDLSGHWQRTQAFLGIVDDYLDRIGAAPDAEERRRDSVARIAQFWAENPPDHPIIIAGSSGSRGTSSLLMQEVARLPQGAVVLPGFDFDMPAAIWAALGDPLLSEDHPQYRFIKLAAQLGLSRADIAPWHESVAPAPARNALVSLSLRPAPVTDAWRIEGPRLPDLQEATEGLTLVQSASPRAEAMAIALRLRKAAEEGQTAALITPDRMLTRRVTSALDRWNILPDDSAGTPLHLSPPGRFLRHVADMLVQKLDAEALLTLLKHPLTHSGAARNEHQLATQKLELRIRRRGLPYPDGPGLEALIPEEGLWRDWLIGSFTERQAPGVKPLAQWTALHLEMAEAIAMGPDATGTSELWRRNAGEKAAKVMANLQDNAHFGGEMSAADYADLVGSLLRGEEVRDRDAPHPGIMIWGTMEARVQGADLVILGGLNDGTWPEAPPQDPWLNRKMRLAAGMLLPERRVGLSAHDYQQAIAAPEVWLTRSLRSDDAETVPSRWLNRLTNLMNGLPRQGGVDALKEMAARGDVWLAQARALEAAPMIPSAVRPSPRPPASARLSRLSVTEVKTLIRDPYAIYAKHILRLRPLNPLVQSPDAPLRGVIIHAVMEQFIKSLQGHPELLSREHLMDVARQVLQDSAPWPAARAIWLAKIERIADWFISREAERQAMAQPVAFEDAARGQMMLDGLGIELIGFADRIDQNAAGAFYLYDYKTGTPPSKSEQKAFDKQLLIEAAMIEEGAFKKLGPGVVAEAMFIGLGSKPGEVPAPLSEEPPSEVMQNLRDLLAFYQDGANGFTARLALQKDTDTGRYDHLSRFGEWEVADQPSAETLT
ncbi:MAG: double-strand break repair protein AddB [Sulfitobacter sp.]